MTNSRLCTSKVYKFTTPALYLYSVTMQQINIQSVRLLSKPAAKFSIFSERYFSTEEQTKEMRSECVGGCVHGSHWAREKLRQRPRIRGVTQNSSRYSSLHCGLVLIRQRIQTRNIAHKSIPMQRS